MRDNGFSYDFLEMTTMYEQEYCKMKRAHRIKTFMEFELAGCLAEVSWSLRRYNCEVLGCPQEDYPARLLPTLPPGYEDNLQIRLKRALDGVYPPTLKTILKQEYELPILRPSTKISAQVDSVLGEHRTGENSISPECDP